MIARAQLVLAMAGVIMALLWVVWWQDQRNDALRAELNAANARIEAIKKTQEITDDIHSLDADGLGAELDRRLSGAGPE